MTVTDKHGNTVALSDLDFTEIAAALVMLVPGCLTLNHQTLNGTLHYLHPEPGGPAEFVKDIFTLPPAEVARKWYGSEDFAKAMVAKAMGMALFGEPETEDARTVPARNGHNPAGASHDGT